MKKRARLHHPFNTAVCPHGLPPVCTRTRVCECARVACAGRYGFTLAVRGGVCLYGSMGRGPSAILRPCRDTASQLVVVVVVEVVVVVVTMSCEIESGLLKIEVRSSMGRGPLATGPLATSRHGESAGGGGGSGIGSGDKVT